MVAAKGGRRRAGTAGRYIVTIGIDRYESWARLNNAVSDAKGVLETFEALGFQSIRPPLLDQDANRNALWKLVTRDLAELGQSDSLVVFFAGHGWTAPLRLGTESEIQQGFIIPVDGLSPRQAIKATENELRQSWINIDDWLIDIQRLIATHILVILDSCHSGIAIRSASYGPVIHRSSNGPGERLWQMTSRRIITASLATQSAMDSGPVVGHSLFTGCLLEALNKSIFIDARYTYITGTELGAHIQRLVMDHSQQQQTPDVSALACDGRGEMQIPLPSVTQGHATPVAIAQQQVKELRQSIERGDLEPWVTEPSELRLSDIVLGEEVTFRLDRLDIERQLGGAVLAVLPSDTHTDTGWVTWAARRGYFTLATSKSDLTAAIDDLLDQSPWMRALPTARAVFAAAADIAPDELDASLEARSERECEQWLNRVGGRDSRTHVGTWLTMVTRKRFADTLDIAAAPYVGLDLLSAMCDLAGPISILVRPVDEKPESVVRAIHIAASLATSLPDQAIAIAAPHAALTQVLRSPDDSAAMAMARRGLIRATGVHIAEAKPQHTTPARRLWDALQRDSRTANQFELRAPVRIHEQPGSLIVELVARHAQLAIAIDTWYLQQDAGADTYQRDRMRDRWLQRAGFFVLRLLVDDIDRRLESQIERIADCLHARAAAQLLRKDRS